VYAKQDLDGAVEWVQKFEDYPKYDEWQMQLSYTVARETPRLALDLLADLEDSRRLTMTINSIVGIWASKDAQAAADWVMLEYLGVDKTGAIQTLLRVWYKSDKAAAERWAISLPEPADRDFALSLLYSYNDPRSAQARKLLAMINDSDSDRVFSALQLAIPNLWMADQTAAEELIRTSNLTADQEQKLNDAIERMINQRR
jgi:hypothetical protein